MSWAIGVDTGGTFTDVIAMEAKSGRVRTLKVPSTPSDPSQAVLNGVEAFLASAPDVKASDISFFAHGTTVATNAVIENKGVPTGLLITRGTSAVYMARVSRQPAPSEMLNPHFQKPAPLVPARMTREIAERVLFDGSIEQPLDEAAVLAAVTDLVKVYGVRSIAVSYLFSFMAPEHEQRTRAIVKKHFPQVRVSLSSDIIPVIREYRRLSTTVLDAYVGPTLDNYLSRLGSGLRDRGVATRQAFIMQSNGGLMSIKVASDNPVQTLLSGPAAGVISGAYLSQLTGLANVVTFDVGGTSTDIAVIVDGLVTETNEGSVAGHDAAVPMNEIATIGAGGGTIARVGNDRRLKVGPDSAGARPGPACYGHGGEDPTVTDADVVLGYVDPDYFLGGKYKLDAVSARAAVRKKVAEPLGLSLEEAAAGIVTVVNSRMEGELRLSLIARGFDPRAFALVALGGAGPVRACMIAKDLGIQHVIIPPYPGLGSAMGLLMTDVKHSYLLSRLKPLLEFEGPSMDEIFETLVLRGKAEAEAEGTDVATLQTQLYLDLRYAGQGYELSVPCPAGAITPAVKEALALRFHEMHRTIYGHNAPDKALEVVNFRLVTIARLPKLKLTSREADPAATLAMARKSTRRAYFADACGWVETPVYERTLMQPGHEVAGPAIIEQADSTTVVASGQVARPDAYGNLIVSLTSSAGKGGKKS
jgi:N-methylhydantoinase A